MANLGDLTAAQVIDRLGLEYLNGEGVWIKLIWRSNAGNAIFAMLTRDDYSALHRLMEDELWTHVAGSSIEMLLLHPGGRSETTRIGPGLDDSAYALVPAGCHADEARAEAP